MPMLKTIMAYYLSCPCYITIFKINYIVYIPNRFFHSANCELADVNNQKNIKDDVQFKDEKKQC